MRKLLFAASLASAMVAGAAANQLKAQEQVTGEVELTRPQVEGIVREYLLSNPEILLEMQSALEEKMKNQQAQASQQAIAGSAEQIFQSAHDGIIGNPDGDVTIVEFFDYNCGYCKRALSDMEALLAKDGNLRFVLKEFPILGPDSHAAHVVSMAFRKLAPEKYGEFHRRLLGSQGRANEETAMRIATDLGVEEAALRESMKDPEIEKAFAETYQLANTLQINGTPSYVVGQEVVYGALGQDHLTEKIAAARQ
ncbi:DsbA family protein [Chelativorans sp. AA-79]|uniref:DsbA family protein n=1 Tax=Chelativorans sp. AA-79 TaxID=3028735 RepID=UPI0023F65446|nr:DsbA family protein [Chelativorans sp. AA-79]WEX07080.1 DsbA family protein [Chelativorans sp. AA-79]